MANGEGCGKRRTWHVLRKYSDILMETRKRACENVRIAISPAEIQILQTCYRSANLLDTFYSKPLS
jgi:hypothetical protein